MPPPQAGGGSPPAKRKRPAAAASNAGGADGEPAKKQPRATAGAFAPGGAPPPAAAEAWLSFCAARDALAAEVTTLALVIYKNQNQHRRTRYWQAARRVHKTASRLSAGMRGVGQGDFLPPPPGAPAPAGARADAARRICADAGAALLLHARGVTAQQTGAGFAALLAVLGGSAAQCVYLALRMRDALGVVAPPAVAPGGEGAGGGARAAAPGAPPVRAKDGGAKGGAPAAGVPGKALQGRGRGVAINTS